MSDHPRSLLKDRYAVNVITSPVTCALNCCSGRFAGPLTTAPEVVNVEPWQGQTNCDPEKPLIVQASCVQTAVRAVALAAPVRVTRNVPIDVCATAMAPVEPRVEPSGAWIVMVRPLTDAVAEASDCVFDYGPVVLLPPQPTAAPRAMSPAALPQQAQNWRRLGVVVDSSLIMDVTSSGQIL